MSVRQSAIRAARALRKNPTAAECVFWERVRKKQFMGYRFLRQHPLLYKYYGRQRFFIADFYCRALSLVVEIDGGIHEKQKEYDRVRSEILEVRHNLRVIRFSNDEVLDNMNKVLIRLKRYVDSYNTRVRG